MDENFLNLAQIHKPTKFRKVSKPKKNRNPKKHIARNTIIKLQKPTDKKPWKQVEKTLPVEEQWFKWQWISHWKLCRSTFGRSGTFPKLKEKNCRPEVYIQWKCLEGIKIKTFAEKRILKKSPLDLPKWSSSTE